METTTTKTTAMTEKDLRLIEQANATKRWYWRDIDDLIAQADTREAAERLFDIKWELHDLDLDSL